MALLAAGGLAACATLPEAGAPATSTTTTLAAHATGTAPAASPTRTAPATEVSLTEPPATGLTAAPASPTNPPASPTPPPTSQPATSPASATAAPVLPSSAPTAEAPTAPPAATGTPSAHPPAAGSTPPSAAGNAAGLLVVNDLGDAADAALDGRCETAPGGACTLRAALQEANAQADLDTIVFAEGLGGTLTLTSALPAVTDGVVLAGPGPAWLTLHGGRHGYRVLTFDSPGDNQAFDLSGVTVTNGQSALGGGLYLGTGDILVVNNTALVANAATGGGGGGVYNAGGDLSLSSVQISANTAMGAGGGVYNVDGSLTLLSAIVLRNEAAGGEGGGVRFAGTSLNITASTFRDNLASANGGGLWSSGNATLTGVTLEANAAVNGGGAYNRSGILTVQGSTLAANRGANGAGLFNAGGTVFVTNATLSGNAAAQDGGGLYNSDTVTLNNVTVAFNSAGQRGGGLVNQGGTLSLKNTLAALQTSGGDCAGSLISLGHNLDSDQTCGLTSPGDLPGVDPLLDPLAYTGGSTATHRLQASSPAIDRANDSGCPTVSQRGFPRPQDGPDADAIATCDIGAVEYRVGADP